VRIDLVENDQAAFFVCYFAMIQTVNMISFFDSLVFLAISMFLDERSRRPAIARITITQAMKISPQITGSAIVSHVICPVSANACF
jgi:hypothetical protein